MDGVAAGGTTWLYASVARHDAAAPFGQKALGIGVARFDPASNRFVPEPTFLWTADRASYGTAVVPSGGSVYVYGCESQGLDAHCFVARAAPDKLDQPSAYAYYTGSDHWSSSIEDALPVVPSAGNPISVAPDPAAGGWLMTYVPPLGSTMFVRRGLAPEGPWSSAYPLADCDLVDSDTFCTGAFLHPELFVPGGSIAVSYALGSFSADFGDRALASPATYGPRLAVVALPRELP
jgi:hypothetical protein